MPGEQRDAFKREQHFRPPCMPCEILPEPSPDPGGEYDRVGREGVLRG